MVACQSELLRFSSRVATLKSVVTVASVYLRLLQKYFEKLQSDVSENRRVLYCVLVVVAKSGGNVSGAYMHLVMHDAPT